MVTDPSIKALVLPSNGEVYCTLCQQQSEGISQSYNFTICRKFYKVKMQIHNPNTSKYTEKMCIKKIGVMNVTVDDYECM